MSRLYFLHQQRVRIVLNTIICIGLIIVLRFFYIQILNASEYRDNISERLNYNKIIKGDRGKIFDRNGTPLAENITKITLWVNTRKEIDENHIASFFHKEFGVDEVLTLELLQRKKTNYLPIKKDIISENLNELINKIKNMVPSALFPEYETNFSSSALVTCLGKRLDYVVSIDNGVMHMLSLSKVPMIVLFGPTDSGKFAPDYKNSIVLDSKKLHNTKNVSSITVKDVLNAAKQHLNFNSQ